LIAFTRYIFAAGLVLLLPGTFSPRSTFKLPGEPPTLFAFHPAPDWVYFMFPEARIPYGRLIKTAARAHGVDPHLVAAVVAAESGFDAAAVSYKGAVGLMQVIPASVEEWDRLLEPGQNLKTGVAHLKSLLEFFDGDLIKSLAAYNCGLGRLQRTGAIPAKGETPLFLRNVLEYYAWFWSGAPGPGFPPDAAQEHQAGVPR